MFSSLLLLRSSASVTPGRTTGFVGNPFSSSSPSTIILVSALNTCQTGPWEFGVHQVTKSMLSDSAMSRRMLTRKAQSRCPSYRLRLDFHSVPDLKGGSVVVSANVVLLWKVLEMSGRESMTRYEGMCLVCISGLHILSSACFLNILR